MQGDSSALTRIYCHDRFVYKRYEKVERKIQCIYSKETRYYVVKYNILKIMGAAKNCDNNQCACILNL